ncbi:MAG: HAD family hydrolase [Salinirussus sp.]
MTEEYEAVVFDNDGVIVEPTARERLVGAVREAFREFGHDPPREAVERAVATGAGPEDTVGDREIDTGAFWQRREASAAAAQKAAIREGEKTLYRDVDALSRLDARLGLVSNNQAETVAFIVDYFGLDRFETVYGRDPSVAGVERKKPDPYYLEQALDDLGTDRALYVGDSETDIVAADRAGVDSAFLRRPHRAEAELRVDPTYEVSDLRALVDTVRSPPPE